MLNSAFMAEQARVFLKYLQAEAGDDPAGQITLALKRIMQREPSAEDVQRGVALVEALQKQHGVPLADALRHFCLIAFNLNEFVYLD